MDSSIFRRLGMVEIVWVSLGSSRFGLPSSCMTLATFAVPTWTDSRASEHVVLGGRIMGWLFGPEWRDFTLCHSRHWAKRVGKRYSRLCLADKLAFVLTPGWLYLPMARLSGELQEYMRVASGRQLCGSITDFEQSLLNSRNSRVWLEGLKIYTRRWVEQHRNGTRDHWTVLRSQPQPENAIQAQG